MWQAGARHQTVAENRIVTGLLPYYTDRMSKHDTETVRWRTAANAVLICFCVAILANFQTIDVCQSGDALQNKLRRLLWLKQIGPARNEALRIAILCQRNEQLDEVQKEVARALITAGEYAQATAILSKSSLQDQLSEGDRQILLAQSLIARSYFTEALAHLRTAENMIPRQNSMRSELHFELGKCYMALGDLPAAAMEFRRLKKVGNTRCAELYMRLINAKTHLDFKSVADDLRGFWFDYKLEAMPNLQFASYYLRKCGSVSESECLQEELRILQS